MAQTAKAIYLQLADTIMDGILSGTYQLCARVPSVREFAASVEVNANTVMRTYEYLQQLGVIFNKRGIGYFVAENAPEVILDNRRELFFHTETPLFFSRMKQFGVTPDALRKMYDEFLNPTTND